MEELLSRLAWRMPVYNTGSPVHLAILALTLGLVILEICLLKGRKVRETRLLFITGCVLALMEAAKQLLLTYVRGGLYSWSDLPFQLCSIPMYAMLVYPLCGDRGRTVLRRFLMSFGLLGGVAALVEPVSLFTDVVLLTVHSFIWHIALVLAGVLSAAGELRTLPAGVGSLQGIRRLFQPAGRLYLCLAAAAVVLNASLKKVSGGTCNMFFLGPSRPDLFWLDDIYARFGWGTETVFFMALTWVMGLAVTAMLVCSRGPARKNRG